MAGPILSAFSTKPLFATFLTPKTFRIQPIVSASIRHLSTSHSNQERKKPWLSTQKKEVGISSSDAETVYARDSNFKHHLWLRGVTKWDVQDKAKLYVNEDDDPVPAAVHELKQIIHSAEETTASSDPAYALPAVERIDSEKSWLSYALPALLPTLTSAPFGFSYHNTEDFPWYNHPDLRPDLKPRLSWPKPDLAHGFLNSRWTKLYPRATRDLGLYMSVSENMAFPFFMLEGKGPSTSHKDEKKKLKIALYQNLNSTSRALRNLHHLHLKATAIANRHLNDDPADHIAALTVPADGRVFSYNMHAGVSITGDKWDFPSSSGNDLSTTSLAPYATFDASVVILSTILTTKSVHLDAHWISAHSPWVAPRKHKGPKKGPYYLRHRLRSWDLPSEMDLARAGVAAAIKAVGDGLEGRLHAYMRILEDELAGGNVEIPRKEGQSAVGHVKLPRVEDLVRGLAVSTTD